MVVCGIPEITLLGTAEDWRRIRERLDVIAELDLALWCQSLVPIIDQFVRAAAGDIDVNIWRRIYNPIDAYGGEIITGWSRACTRMSNPGISRARELPSDIPLLGTSFAAILDAALASDGDIEHLEVGRFAELLRI